MTDIAMPGEAFPPLLTSYPAMSSQGLMQTLVDRVHAEPFNLVATVIFLLAIIHTFLTPKTATGRTSSRPGTGTARAVAAPPRLMTRETSSPR